MSPRRILVLAAALLGLGAIVDIVVGVSTPGLMAALGFVGCVTIVVVAKWLGVILLQRPEAYYADTDHPEVRDHA